MEGIAPKLQIDLMSFGNFNLHVGGGVLYNPWGFLVFSQGSVLTIGMIGAQRWPYRWQHGGISLNGDVELVRQIRGHADVSHGAGVRAGGHGGVGLQRGRDLACAVPWLPGGGAPGFHGSATLGDLCVADGQVDAAIRDVALVGLRTLGIFA